MGQSFIHLTKPAIWLVALSLMLVGQAVTSPYADAKLLPVNKQLYNHTGRRWVLQPRELIVAAFVVQVERHKNQADTNDRVYVQGQLSKDQSRYNIVQRNGIYLDPTTNELLGLEVKNVGVAELITIHQGVSIMQIISASQSIRIGDKLIPQSWSLAKNAPIPELKPFKVTIQGQIIGLLDNTEAQQKIIAINQGLREGIEKGNLLSFYNDAATAKDEQLLTGSVVVLQVFDKMSYGVVLKLNKEPAIGDLLRGSE